MKSVYDLKPAFQNLLRPLVNRLAARGVTPNALTLAALGLSAAVGVLLAFFPAVRPLYLLVPAALFVRMALNAADGMLAREHGLTTPLGAFLNELADPLSDAALYLPFTFVTGSPLVASVVVLAAVSELAGVLGLTVGASRRYDGPLGKSDRAVAFGALALVLALWRPPPGVVTAFFALLMLLLFWTIANRVRGALAERA